MPEMKAMEFTDKLNLQPVTRPVPESDNPSWDKGWSGYLAGKNSTQGGDR